jgi:uncharacterized protein YndB with AHSA1/START domain
MSTNNNLTATASVVIHKPASVVWQALIDPEKIKEYLFGTQTETDWKPGSPIFFRGSWQGQRYEDKGTILKVENEKLLSYTYWSSMSGKEDIPDNYNTVTFTLAPAEGSTQVTIVQDNNASEESRAHSESNWNMVLTTMKEKVEQG